MQALTDLSISAFEPKNSWRARTFLATPPASLVKVLKLCKHEQSEITGCLRLRRTLNSHGNVLIAFAVAGKFSGSVESIFSSPDQWIIKIIAGSQSGYCLFYDLKINPEARSVNMLKKKRE